MEITKKCLKDTIYRNISLLIKNMPLWKIYKNIQNMQKLLKRAVQKC